VATLETLLNATTPNGQIPANVRLDDGVPDYSGVGSIASIDSGLWVIIALYTTPTTPATTRCSTGTPTACRPS
jgi:hypothetical protein